MKLRLVSDGKCFAGLTVDLEMLLVDLREKIKNEVQELMPSSFRFLFKNVPQGANQESRLMLRYCVENSDEIQGSQEAFGRDIALKMITRFIVFTVLLSNIAIAAVLDQEPPVFTYCPKDINIDDITNTVIRVNWDRPLAKDNSGAPSSIQCNRVSGEEYSVPGSYQVFCEAKDQAGNKAECTFQLVLKKKQCPLYKPPKNGVLACLYFGSDPACAPMCQKNFDFAFRPPWMYLCSGGKWHNLGPGNYGPWPDCSGPSDGSKMLFPEHYFDGDQKDPVVQIRMNLISLMKMFGFCNFGSANCVADKVEVYF
ncbi:uncharacterized protein LOC111341904 [Stylophora pistillata]|uniref:uncharacterized protein LOC111341904 n=1 Tax=Stylophora pistillata TaxID=50429 RepID=UPI000C04EA79|nr:uncharacterized protein LOC111341904 [Stylophora pistillata]